MMRSCRFVFLVVALPASALAQATHIVAISPSLERTVSAFVRQISLSYRGGETGIPISHHASMIGLRWASPDAQELRGDLSGGVYPASVRAGSSQVWVAEAAGKVQVEFAPIGTGESARLGFPLIVGATYRRMRVRAEDGIMRTLDNARFSIGQGVAVLARVGPLTVIDMSSAAFTGGDAMGNRFSDAGWHNDAAIHRERALGNRFGLTFGASYVRERRYDAVRRLFPTSSNNLFHFGSVEWSARLGLHW